MKKFTAFAVCVFLILGCLLLPSCTPKKTGTKDQQNSTPSPSQPDQQTSGAVESEKVPSAPQQSSSDTPAPSSPAVEPSESDPVTPSEPPVTPTPPESPTVPSESEPSESIPDGPIHPTINAAGHAVSDTGTALNLWLDWSIETLEDGSYKVHADIYLDSYSISCRPRDNLSRLSIGDTDFIYSTPKLSYEKDSGRHHTHFTSADVTYKAGELPQTLEIEASWFFNGTYSGVEISTIIVSASIDTTAL